MNPVIEAVTAKGRSPYDPSASVYRLSGKTDWATATGMMTVTMNLSVPSRPATISAQDLAAWKLPFDLAALDVSIVDAPAIIGTPPALQVLGRGGRLLGVFGLSADPVQCQLAQYHATLRALREVQSLGLAASGMASSRKP